MKYASEDLINEHDGILFGLKIFEKMVGLVEKDKKIEIDHIKEMAHFLKLFADQCHHGKEEGLLFPEMEKAGIANEKGPIGQMLAEHEEGRKYLSQVLESVKNKFKKSDFIDGALKYIDFLRNHIEKENTVLFPLGNERIPLATQQQLLESFKDFEENGMGTGTHEKLHELLDKMEEIYLKG